MRGLVEHSLRSGDLDLESFGGVSPLEAIRAHQKVQGSRPEGYRREVPVSRVFERQDCLLEVQGRIDGVWERPEGPLVEEIKTTRGELEAQAATEKAPHWGQLRVYAFLQAEERHLPAIDARLTYYDLESGRTLEVDRRFALVELGEFIHELVSRYVAWILRVLAWTEARNAAIESTAFPFPSYRRGQRGMAVAVYRAIEEGSEVLVQAPTGIGKTQAALFPAVKAMGKGHGGRVFYLTARGTGRALAEKALGEMRRGGAKLRSLTLTAKEKICFNPEKACNGEECEFARGFYDRIRDALEEALGLEELTRSGIEALARRHRVCPFELSLEIAPWSDVLVGDYNYAFDPRVHLRGALDDVRSDAVLLVDEAHNLLERARDMLSAALSRKDLLALHRSLRGSGDSPLSRSLRKASSALGVAGKRASDRGGAFSEEQLPVPILSALLELLRDAEAALASRVASFGARRREILDLYFEAAWFIKVAERWDDSYAACYEARGRDVRVKLLCRDPAPRLRERFSRARASILFSATLAPADYFRRCLGLATEARAVVLPSPFPPENIRVLLAPWIATTYRKRAATEEALTLLLAEFVRSRRGNYLLYFPSYEYLDSIRRRFEAECPDVDVAFQKRDMAEEKRETFLGRFEKRQKTLVGFAVLGGVFGEAIDLPGDKLEGAAVVGVGLPALSPERDRIRAHFDREEGAGYEYAYLYPGMNRVLQAAGRVIRTETDRGAVLLVDERFAERRYRSLFPRDWSPRSVQGPTELRNELERFWLG